VVWRQKSMKLTMRDRSQRPQLSVAAAVVGWEPLEAQPFNSSVSTVAKQTIRGHLPSFTPFLPLSEILTLMLLPFSKQEAGHEPNINIRHTLYGMAGVGSDANRNV
jgi:hypothetical protein